MNKIKRLFFDIETAPNFCMVWQTGYKIQVDYHNIIKERAVICICYKWEGSNTVYSLTWDGKQNDKTMIKEFIKIMDKADEVVAHNGDRFDIAWLRTRCAFHGIPMMPNYTSIDTLKAVRNKFKFNSNRLDYLAKYFKIGGKIENGGLENLKKIVLNKDKSALSDMVRYCKNDVVILEKVFDKLVNYIPAKTHIGRIASNCPECDSENTVINKHRLTAQGNKQVTYKCNDCGKYHTVSLKKFNNGKK